MGKNGATATASKKPYVKQADVPRLSLQQCLRVAQGLFDNFAGRSAPPHQLALAIDISPTSSFWRELTGAALAYGLTDAAWSATAISLTDLGRRIVAPTAEGQDAEAKAEAALRPTVFRKFFEKYDRAKFPQDAIAKNVLQDFGVPRDRLERTLQIVKENGAFTGLIQETKTGPFVAIDTAGVVPQTGIGQAVGTAAMTREEEPVEATLPAPQETRAVTQRVFVAHGKSKEIVGQLKDLLIFGKFTPVVAEEHETTAKPVPDKVMDDMRSCFAGVIHVASEERLLDEGGKEHHKLNENVLVEIGAAMALYGRKLVLLVQKGIHLPSNLQGLYVCYYEGEKLDYEATMKLLKTFNEFR